MARNASRPPLAWLLLVWLAAPCSQAGETLATIVVIAHDGFAQNALTPAEIAAIFRRTETIDQRGQALVPVNLPGSHGLRRAFSRAMFNREPAEMEAYWNERYFHGVAPPHVVASVEAMLRFVAATDGAIGYVPACAVDARVKVVARIAASHELPAAFECGSQSIPKLQTELAH